MPFTASVTVAQLLSLCCTLLGPDATTLQDQPQLSIRLLLPGDKYPSLGLRLGMDSEGKFRDQRGHLVANQNLEKEIVAGAQMAKAVKAPGDPIVHIFVLYPAETNALILAQALSNLRKNSPRRANVRVFLHTSPAK